MSNMLHSVNVQHTSFKKIFVSGVQTPSYDRLKARLNELNVTENMVPIQLEPSNTHINHYTIINGKHRVMAAIIAGLKTVPAKINK